MVGTAAAWLVERTTLPGRRVFGVLLAAPLAIPAFVNSFAWVSVVPSASGYGGALLIVTLSYYPFVYLPVAAMLRGLDPALEETAQSLGLGGVRTFLRTTLPQLRPALLGGCLLVGLHLLAEFGALQMLRFPTFTTAIYDQYQSTFSGPAANMLAGVLVLCCLLLLVGELRLRGRTRYARTGGGVARQAVRTRLGVFAVPAVLVLVALVVLAVGVPLGSLAFWLATGSSAGVDVEMLLRTTGTSVGLGLLGAAVTTVLAIPVAWLSIRHRGRLSTTVERAHLHRQRAAGHRGRARARDGRDPDRAGPVPDHGHAGRRLRDPVHAARDGQHPGVARAGPAGARGRRDRAGQRSARRCCAG